MHKQLPSFCAFCASLWLKHPIMKMRCVLKSCAHRIHRYIPELWPVGIAVAVTVVVSVTVGTVVVHVVIVVAIAVASSFITGQGARHLQVFLKCRQCASGKRF